MRRYLWYLTLAISSGVGAGILAAGAGGRLVMRLLAVTAGPDAQGRVTEAEQVIGRITVDGVPASSLTNYAAGGAGARVVTFFPDDIRVVKGAPSDRREFLDALLSSLRPAYARAAVEYARAVQQRNQLLRRIRDGFSSERTLATWDRKVVDLGKIVLAGREAVGTTGTASAPPSA